MKYFWGNIFRNIQRTNNKFIFRDKGWIQSPKFVNIYTLKRGSSSDPNFFFSFRKGCVITIFSLINYEYMKQSRDGIDKNIRRWQVTGILRQRHVDERISNHCDDQQNNKHHHRIHTLQTLQKYFHRGQYFVPFLWLRTRKFNYKEQFYYFYTDRHNLWRFLKSFNNPE